MARRLFHRIKEVAHQLGEPVSMSFSVYWRTPLGVVCGEICGKTLSQ